MQYLEKQTPLWENQFILTALTAIVVVSPVFILGLKGLFAGIALLILALYAPLSYRKTGFMLFISIFLYPLSRILSGEGKMGITVALYTICLPCLTWIILKNFNKFKEIPFFLYPMIFYMGIVVLNLLRPHAEVTDFVREFGRDFFALFIVLGAFEFVKQDARNLKKFIFWVNGIMNVLALISVGQYVTKIGGIVIEGYYRVRGTFTNSNDYAFILAVFLCFAFAMFLISEIPRQKFYWIATIGLNSLVLVATFSKTSIVNTVFAMAIIAWFLPLKTKIRLFAALIFSGVALAIFMIYTGSLNLIIQRFQDNSSLDWRFEIWQHLKAMIFQGNILFGQGIEASRTFLERIMPIDSSNAPHNIYLETWYNFGLVGLVSFIMTFVFLALRGMTMIFSGKEPVKNKIIGTAILGITFIALVQNSFSNAYYDRAGNIIFWAIVAAMICIYKNNVLTHINRI
jgi:O-antigen ligase